MEVMLGLLANIEDKVNFSTDHFGTNFIKSGLVVLQTIAKLSALGIYHRRFE